MPAAWTAADGLLLALGLALVGALWAVEPGDRGPASLALVRAADGRTLELPLDRDARVEVSGPLGASLLEIRHGRVRFLDSPCPQKRCVRAGWLDRPGEAAACLPNGVTVEVVALGRRYDAINF